jgi:glutathione S-transferase
MDAALRHVAHALLVGVQEKQVMEHALQLGAAGTLSVHALV